MTRDRKLLLFTLLVSATSILLIIYRYEKLIGTEKKELITFQKVIGGLAMKQYTADEIIQLIKQSDVYLGDSITIYENGEIKSSNEKFQGTLNAVTKSKENMNMVVNDMKSNKLPIQYNVYRLAATYYRQQYGTETVNPK